MIHIEIHLTWILRNGLTLTALQIQIVVLMTKESLPKKGKLLDTTISIIPSIHNHYSYMKGE